MRRLIVTLALLAVVAGRAWAGFDEGKAAFERGDWPAAFAQWRPCAEAGDAACQNGLGALYRLGRGVPQDLAAAAEWFRKAAVQGFAKAQANLAAIYVEGAGQPQDHVAAAQWYRKAAEQGFALAQRELGRLYAEGSGVSKDEIEAFGWYRKAAEQGDAESEYILAFAYARGQGVAVDQAQAASWNRKAAEHGYALAQHQLGTAYLYGQGMPPDAAEAARWFQAAADQGNADAQYNLAVLYSAGTGVAQDYGQAVHWFQAAADQGEIAAHYSLGVLYYRGQWRRDEPCRSRPALRGGGRARLRAGAIRARRHVPQGRRHRRRPGEGLSLAQPRRRHAAGRRRPGQRHQGPRRRRPLHEPGATRRSAETVPGLETAGAGEIGAETRSGSSVCGRHPYAVRYITWIGTRATQTRERQDDKDSGGKVALVTGGSRGIGAAIAKRLAAEGADVAISYAVSAAKAKAVVRDLEAEGVHAASFKADQADPTAVEGLVKAVAERFGRLDILVNSAGLLVSGVVDDPASSAAKFDRQFAVNVGGVAAAVRVAVRFLGEGGRIISIGSVVGSRTPFRGLADYSATKAAIAAYTRGWARDLGPKGITVNIVQPGPIDTDMNPADGDSAVTQKARTSLGRFGKPAEVAAAVAFLAGPDAAYITGATLDVDGGWNA